MADILRRDASCPCCKNKEALLPSPLYTRCSCCGHRWRLPLYNGTAHYEALKERNDAQTPWFRRKTNERLVALLELIGPEVQRILEIGCAEGTLGALVKERVSVIYDGVEVSLDSLVAEKNLDHVFRTPSIEVQSLEYDLIVSLHVLEHIDQLGAELASWKRLLKPSGKLLIEVPNQSGHPLVSTDINPEHIHQFTPASLAVLLERSGFSCREISAGHYESPAYPDSIRVVAIPQVDDENRSSLLMDCFKKTIKGPFVVYGVGGDFHNYILPLIDLLDIKALVDSSPNKWGMDFGRYRVSSFDPSEHGELPILICSLGFFEEIRQALLEKGVNPGGIIGLEHILNESLEWLRLKLW